MSLLSIAGATPSDEGFELKSARFEDGGPAYMDRTPGSAGDRKTWTWSSWVKRGNSGSQQNIFVFGAANADHVALGIKATDDLIENLSVAEQKRYDSGASRPISLVSYCGYRRHNTSVTSFQSLYKW